MYISESVKAVNPFLDRIPMNLHDDFMTDYIDIVIKMKLSVNCNKTAKRNFITPYKLVIAYGKK